MSVMSDSPMINLHKEEEVSLWLVFFVGVWVFFERGLIFFCFFSLRVCCNGVSIVV
jgi:hypothetical protein